jgi:hypothetical protein
MRDLEPVLVRLRKHLGDGVSHNIRVLHDGKGIMLLGIEVMLQRRRGDRTLLIPVIVARLLVETPVPQIPTFGS